MPDQLSEHAVTLLRKGETLSFGNRSDNLVPAKVVGPGHLPDSVTVRLLEDYDTRRPSGNSFRRAGVEITAKAGSLWHAQFDT